MASMGMIRSSVPCITRMGTSIADRSARKSLSQLSTQAYMAWCEASNQWTVRDFYPIDYLPRGVRLTAYGGGAADLPPRLLQGFLDSLAAGTIAPPIGRVYHLDQIVAAHADMEANKVSGKLVVVT